jgi:hypothetical protein
MRSLLAGGAVLAVLSGEVDMSQLEPFERNVLRLAMLALLAAIIGCSGAHTKFEQVWHVPPSNMSSVQRIATLYESHDGAMRRTVEDQMARKLVQRGVQAVPAYMVLDEEGMADKTKAKDELAAKGFDGVLEIRLISVESYPGQTAATTGTYDWYWGVGWPATYDTYAFDSPIVRIETNLYSLTSKDLIWSARSKTVDPDDTNEVIDGVTTLVASTLQTRGVAVATARR